MRLRVIALSALAVVLAVASPAGAGRARTITLQVGDAFAVAGTNVACRAQIGQNVMKGQKLVTCFTVKNGKLPANSYVAALGANARVVVAPVKAGQVIGAPVFDRKPASARSRTKEITVHAGDQLRLKGTGIYCGINNDASGVYPTCFVGRGSGVVPKSYAFAVTTAFVAVVQFNAAGTMSKLVFKRAYK